MQRLSAIDAIYPAFQRTREILFQPFRLGRSWKLAACGYVAMGGSSFVPFPFAFLAMRELPFGEAPHMGQIFATLAVLATIVTVLFFYLGSRMQFVVFDIVLNRSQFVAPAWRRFGPLTWPWTGFKLILGTIGSTAAWVVLKPLLREAFLAFADLPKHLPAGPNPEFPPAFEKLMGLYTFAGIGIYGSMLIFSLLCDFVLPPIALEEMALLPAIRGFFRLLVQQPLDMAGFVVVKIALAFVSMMTVQAVGMIVMLPVMLVVGAIAAFGYLVGYGMLHAATPLLVFGGIMLFLCLFAAISFVTVGVYGATILFLQAYSMYFLGGRYNLLGNLLEPSTAAPFTPPPPTAGPDEDDGPGFPMDPAVA